MCNIFFSYKGIDISSEKMSLPWTMVGWTSDITARPRAVHVDGTALVTYRDAADAPRVVPMHCPHRGASLLRGRIEGPCVVCPYHGREVSPLGVDRVDVRDGMMWMKTCADENDQDVTAPPPRLPEWDDPGYTTFEYTRRVASAVDAMVENTLDWHHVDHVHSTSLARGVVPVMTFSSDGHGHGRVVYRYDDGFSVENEFWAPYTTVIRFVVKTSVMILWMSAAPADDARQAPKEGEKAAPKDDAAARPPA
jgi:phenylpropionate dioxygenase-like ring-hydroxylating dioxygenase large terminal subunit